MGAGNVAVQSTSVPPEFTIKIKKDGVEVTAQEFYDAFMAGPVYVDFGISAGMHVIGTVLAIGWGDSTGANTDSSDVVYVQAVVAADESVAIEIGTKPER